MFMDDMEMFGMEHGQKTVLVCRNGAPVDSAKELQLLSTWTKDNFLNAASKRLELAASRRLFNVDGCEVDDLACVEDGEIVFVSAGEGFQPPGGKGQEIVGGYVPGRFLGKGGFGEVRLGTHAVTKHVAALKFMSKDTMDDTAAAARVANEIQCLTALRHPNVIKLLHVLNEAASVVLVFEYASGGDLMGYLVDQGGKLTEETARPLLTQNLLLADDTGGQVKIADFGLSAFFRPGKKTQTEGGSLSYMAPEVFEESSCDGPPLDVWSVGVILFAMVCGRLPFEDGMIGDDDAWPGDGVITRRIKQCQYEVDESLSGECRDLVRRMLRPDPQERATIPEHEFFDGVAVHFTSPV
eukprot:g1714.t1